jgi:hypothetical protein
VPRLGDHQRRARAHDADRLAQDRLEPPRILVSRKLARTLRRLELVQRDDAPLGLGDGLLRDHEHVTGLQLHPSRDQLREIVARPDLREALDRVDLDHRPVTRMPAWPL